MKELVGLFQSKGCTNVRTCIQSGNVVFDSPMTWGAADVAGLGRAIAAAKGFTPHILVLDASELEAAIASNPFTSTDGKSLHFFFLDSIPKTPDVARLSRLKASSEQFALAGRVFYLLAPEGIGRSRLAPAVESALGVPTTARNGNTVQHLANIAR